MQRKGKEFTSLNVDWTLDNLLCNYKRQVQIPSLRTFVKIVWCCVLKYQSFVVVVVVTFFIKTIAQWPPLYASRSCSYFILKLLPRAIMTWSNSPSPFAINNFFSRLLSPIPFTLMTTTIMVTNLRLWIKLLNSLMESCEKTWEVAHVGM